jgi:hypothetical protein
MERLQPPLLCPNILLATLFSDSLMCSFPNARDQVSHPHKCNQLLGSVIKLSYQGRLHGWRSYTEAARRSTVATVSVSRVHGSHVQSVNLHESHKGNIEATGWWLMTALRDAAERHSVYRIIGAEKKRHELSWRNYLPHTLHEATTGRQF